MNNNPTMCRLLVMAAMLVGMSLTATAQRSLYVLKGNTVVATHEVSDGDYATFERPTTVPVQQSVTLEGVATGKNFIQYKVTTTSASQYYAHAFFQSNTLDQVLQQYYGVKLSEADELTIKAALRLLVQYDGNTDQGTQTYTITNGRSDGQGTNFHIPAGQDFYVVANNLTSVDDQGGTAQMGDELSVVKLTTSEAETSSETIAVEYTGLTDDLDATFSITPSSGIVTLYTLLAKKKELDQNVSIYGFDKVFFDAAEPWTATEWTRYGDQQSWSLDGEDDYVMTVLGIDGNGDWVKSSCEQHIATAADNCPKVEILTKEAGDGSVSVTFGVTPSSVTASHVRLMKENDLENLLNQPGTTLDQVATDGDATDLTATINASGKATFTQSDLSRGWYALLISATDANGTTVTEADFHSHLDNAEWEITTTAFPVASKGAKKWTLPMQPTDSRSLQHSLKSLAPATRLAATTQETASADSLFVVVGGALAGTYEIGTETDGLSFTAPETPVDGNVFVYDGTSKTLKSAFYLVNEQAATVDFYLTYANITDAKLVEDCYQYAHICVPLSALGKGGFDITSGTEFQFDFRDNIEDETFHLNEASVGSATGTINVSQQGDATYTIVADIQNFGASHTFQATYKGVCLPYDLSTPNAYRLQGQDDVAIHSAVVAHSGGLYTIYLSRRQNVTTVEGMTDADVVIVTPEEFLNDGLKGFSGDDTRAKINITYDGTTYNQANTTKGGDAALAMGGNAKLELDGTQANIDFAVYAINKYSKANLTGHYEGKVTVVE